MMPPITGNSMKTRILGLSMLLASTVCAAQDVSLLAGRLDVTHSDQSSFAAELGYAYRLGNFFSLSANYLNEGHPRLHHRDGLTPQLWLHSATPEQGWSVEYGIGPYYYYDTTNGLGGAPDYRNLHGRGSVQSLGLIWHLATRTYVELRANRVRTGADGDSTSVLLGMGYELRNLSYAVRELNAETGDDSIMLQAGQAIVNSFESERARAMALEFRRTMSHNMEWSAMLLNEGRIGLVARKGLAAQLWLLMPFTDRTVLEIGGGPYLLHDRINRRDATEESRNHLVPIVSVGVRYRISASWRAQLSWSRVVTDYHRDSDVLLLGLGRTF
jgi:hypothetical protein